MDDEIIKLGDTEFPFGKHKGHTIWWVVDEDISYIIWFYDNCHDRTSVFYRRFKRYVDHKFPHGIE